ncbi:hypothetical protein COCOBI_pt-1150 (chloroplast) [Coccomyxa sp. Obi]|nr:hypothetical protein COCOBI_pt-1150 [Coccomyxa sp. Obi]
MLVTHPMTHNECNLKGAGKIHLMEHRTGSASWGFVVMGAGAWDSLGWGQGCGGGSLPQPQPVHPLHPFRGAWDARPCIPKGCKRGEGTSPNHSRTSVRPMRPVRWGDGTHSAKRRIAVRPVPARLVKRCEPKAFLLNRDLSTPQVFLYEALGFDGMGAPTPIPSSPCIPCIPCTP